MSFTPTLIGSVAFSSVTSASIATGNIAVGTRILIALSINAGDWDDLTDSQSSDLTTPTTGNQYHEQTGTAHPNGTCGVWFATCPSTVTQLRGGGTNDHIILTRAAGMSGRMAAFSVAGLTSGIMDSGSTGFGTSVSPLAALDNITVNDYVVGIVGVAGPSTDGFTQDATFSNPGNLNTQTTTAISVYSGFKQHLVAGSIKYQPTLGVSRDWVALLVALRP